MSRNQRLSGLGAFGEDGMVSKIEPLTAEGKANGRIFVAALMDAPDALPFWSSLGVAGNGWQENLLRPRTLGAQDHNSDCVLQWRDTPPRMRLSDLKAMPGWDTLPVQAQYFKSECKKYYPKLWAVLINPGARSIATLTADIQDYYEVPNPEYANLDNRIAAAMELATVLADLNTAHVPSPAQPQPQSIPIPSLPPIIFPTAPTTGVSAVPPIDPALIATLVQLFAPIAESLVAGIVKGIITQIATMQAAQAKTAGLPALPGLDPNVLASIQATIQASIAAEIAKLTPTLGAK